VAVRLLTAMQVKLATVIFFITYKWAVMLSYDLVIGITARSAYNAIAPEFTGRF